MVKIRLTRLGRKNEPFYRIVVIDSNKKREGEPLDIIGHWHPKKQKIEINKKKLDTWLTKGAQITTGVRKLLK